MAQQYTNNAASTLVTSISAIDTSIQINPSTAEYFPVADGTEWFKATLEDADGNVEIVRVTNRAPGGSILTAVRGQEGTTARAFASGSVIELRLTAADVQTAMGHPTANPAHAATHISYDPTDSGLAATNVQDAIDAVVDAVDAIDNSVYVLRSGDTMTGPLVLHASPTSDMEAATKLYVDNKFVSGGGTGGGGTSGPTDTVFPNGLTVQGTLDGLGADGKFRSLQVTGTSNLPTIYGYEYFYRQKYFAPPFAEMTSSIDTVTGPSITTPQTSGVVKMLINISIDPRLIPDGTPHTVYLRLNGTVLLAQWSINDGGANFAYLYTSDNVTGTWAFTLRGSFVDPRNAVMSVSFAY